MRATRYDGVTHEFFGLAGVVPTAKDALQEAAGALKEAFAPSPVASPAR